ncbi:putative 3-phosphoinositide-dependent protein kinase 2 [Dreissena polymorpha]|uniref:Protein kinase domain-containing protein n=1 Tax=Dreissena polymorpha TaxID=45954 RepID=A0A9D4BIY9_DREPO|nr:putative 3-phosphoinositide-dependent protein kinase 2 [Dreissena polymorpha]KAH3695123.1 hypothetical protein DPMN_082579 [Dreissena polymorpha]
MSNKNNHPVSVDDLTTQIQQCYSDQTFDTRTQDDAKEENAKGSFRYNIRKAKSEKYLKRLPSILSQKKKGDYYLYPIGSSIQSPVKVLPKWTDVASVINQGITTHRNLDVRTASRQEMKTTLSSGTLSSMLVKMKTYAVLPVSSHMISLQQLLVVNEKQRIFEETHAKFVCVNLMLALRFLHENGIFHGSVCPKKVVLNARHYPCLTGFGTADVMDERQSRPRERTTLEYTSPEQLYNEHLTEVTDTFSIGCLTYAMIYGTPPHRGKDVPCTRRNILDKRFMPPFAPEDISQAGKRFLIRCIRKLETKRYNILDAKDSISENITWFSGLSEDKLYKQALPSPLTSFIKQLDKTEA